MKKMMLLTILLALPAAAAMRVEVEGLNKEIKQYSLRSGDVRFYAAKGILCSITAEGTYGVPMLCIMNKATTFQYLSCGTPTLLSLPKQEARITLLCD